MTKNSCPKCKKSKNVLEILVSKPFPSPGLLRGISPPCQSRGWGICKFCAARVTGICQPQVFDTQTILLEKQDDWLICQGREKIEEDCKGMFSILCMHFFIAYQARITHERNSKAIDVNQRFFGYWIKFPLILFEDHISFHTETINWCRHGVSWRREVYS